MSVTVSQPHTTIEVDRLFDDASAGAMVEPTMAPLLHDPACRALLRRHGFRADG